MRRRSRPTIAPPDLEDKPGFRSGHPVDPDPLPPHTGDLVQCKKCGSTGATTKYEGDDGSMFSHGCNTNSGSHLTVWGDRLHRKCKRCGYYWHEAVTS